MLLMMLFKHVQHSYSSIITLHISCHIEDLKEKSLFWFCGNTNLILNSQKFKLSSVAVFKSIAFYKYVFSCNAEFPLCLCVVYFRSDGGHAGCAGQLQYHSEGTEAVLQSSERRTRPMGNGLNKSPLSTPRSHDALISKK